MKAPRLATVMILASLAITPVLLPDVENAQETPEIIQGEVLRVLTFTGRANWSLWHLLTDFPNFYWMEFLDHRNGRLYRVYRNDQVKVVCADGSKLRVYLFGPGAPGGLLFRIVEGSERKPDGTRYGSGAHAGKDRGGDSAGGPTAINSVTVPSYSATWTWGSTVTELRGW